MGERKGIVEGLVVGGGTAAMKVGETIPGEILRTEKKKKKEELFEGEITALEVEEIILGEILGVKMDEMIKEEGLLVGERTAETGHPPTVDKGLKGEGEAGPTAAIMTIRKMLKFKKHHCQVVGS